jgi:hypothetical protein
VETILGAADLKNSAVSSYNGSFLLISHTQMSFGYSLIINLVYYVELPSCSIKSLRELENDSDEYIIMDPDLLSATSNISVSVNGMLF